MPLYANPSINNSVDIFSYANTVTSGFFGIFLLLIIFYVFFMTFKARWATNKALVGSTWMVMLSAILLNTISVVTSEITVACTVLAFASLLLKGGTRT